MGILQDYWLDQHMHEHGDYPLDWDDAAKDEAANEALHGGRLNQHEALKAAMVDFFGNHELSPLYNNPDPAEAIRELRNNVWGIIESDIHDQCLQILESRNV